MTYQTWIIFSLVNVCVSESASVCLCKRESGCVCVLVWTPRLDTDYSSHNVFQRQLSIIVMHTFLCKMQVSGKLTFSNTYLQNIHEKQCRNFIYSCTQFLMLTLILKPPPRDPCLPLTQWLAPLLRTYPPNILVRLWKILIQCQSGRREQRASLCKQHLALHGETSHQSGTDPLSLHEEHWHQIPRTPPPSWSLIFLEKWMHDNHRCYSIDVVYSVSALVPLWSSYEKRIAVPRISTQTS